VEDLVDIRLRRGLVNNSKFDEMEDSEDASQGMRKGTNVIFGEAIVIH
jgi:hypothetical protein